MIYYAVCNIVSGSVVVGPISHKIEAETLEDAVAAFEIAVTLQWIDRGDTDAESDLNISGEGMSESEFNRELKAAGFMMVRDLSSRWKLWTKG